MKGVARAIHRVVHLGRRYVTSLSSAPPRAADSAWSESYLLTQELAMWQRMSAADQRHAVLVARRFVARHPQATRPQIAAALLHDVGKVDLDMGTLARVAATVVGPRTERFRRYHDHEQIGIDMLIAAGSEGETIAVLTGQSAASTALADADNI